MGKKYFLRGLGIGMIFTSIVLFVVTNLTGKKVEISDEEVISRAAILGMVKESEVKQTEPIIIEVTDEEIITKAKLLGMVMLDEKDIVTDIEENSENSIEPIQQDNTNTSEIEEQTEVINEEENKLIYKIDENYVTITITEGMYASDVLKLLTESGLVDNLNEFYNYLDVDNWSRRIYAGTYKFSKGSSYEDILKKIMRGK